MRIRPGSVGDFPTFARLLNEHNVQLRGENLWEVDELAATLISATGAPVDNDRYIEIEGIPVAAIHAHLSEPYTLGTFTLAAPVHERRSGYVRLLLQAGERILHAHQESRPGMVFEVAVPAEDEALLTMVQAAGYHLVYRMTTLEADVFDAPAAHPPSGIAITTFDVATDLEDGYRVVEASFPPALGEWHLSRRDYEYVQLNDPTALPGLSLIARDELGPVAIALNYRDTMQPSSGFIGSLAVLPRRRHEGIGTAMGLASFERFRGHGWHHARLTTVFALDESGDGHRFYSTLGMRPIFEDLVLRKGAN